MKRLEESGLEDIIPHERAMRTKKRLPAAAVPPQLKPRTLKVLGTEACESYAFELRGEPSDPT